MQNREAFIDFVHGLLNISPLERWSPQQARTHPFITQQKYTGPFQPRMDLKSASRSPAPGVQQQQQAEAVSRQRAQQAQAQHAQQAAASAAYAASLHNLTPGYPTSPSVVQTPASHMYGGSMYSPSHQTAPPPYPASVPAAFGQQVPTIQQPPPVAASAGSMHAYTQQQAAQQPTLYAQATTRAGRQRATTMDNNGIPATLQRVVSHLDPNAPIRLQPSPAYYPPPSDGQEPVGNVGGRRRTSRARQDGNRNFIRALEDRTLEEGWNGEGHDPGNPAWHSTYGAV